MYLVLGPCRAGRSVIPTLVVGFGNPLMGDDGVGAAVVTELEQTGVPPGLRLSTLADVLHLSSAWRGEARVWMVDAVLSGAAPGTVHRRGHEEVLGNPQRHATVHHLSLAEGLRWIVHGCPAMAGVRFSLWGVEAERVDLVETLSPVVARAAEAVAREIAHRSRQPVRRPS
jgi:hydrogenase maturation protease